MANPKTPNPRFHLRAGRAMHVDSGSPVTITPVDLDEGEHWTDVNKRKLDEVMAVLGVEVTDGRQLAALITGPSFMLDVAHALASRLAVLEAKQEGKDG
jgi:hypothetical protein